MSTCPRTCRAYMGKQCMHLQVHKRYIAHLQCMHTRCMAARAYLRTQCQHSANVPSHAFACSIAWLSACMSCDYALWMHLSYQPALMYRRTLTACTSPTAHLLYVTSLTAISSHCSCQSHFVSSWLHCTTSCHVARMHNTTWCTCTPLVALPFL